MQVELRGLSRIYPGRAVGVRNIDLSIRSGECLALLGPTGSGKSTLLRLIAGLEEPDSGTIELAGKSVLKTLPHRRGVAYLPQRTTLYPHLNVRENIASGTSGRALHIPEISDILSLAPLLNRRPHELSGGERQRVAWAKLVSREAPIWLLDEPFGGLDPVFRSEFRPVLPLLASRFAATIVLVTHDPVDAWAFGHRVAVLGEGSVQQIGTPDQLRIAPSSRFVAHCLGGMSLIGGRIGDGDHSERIFVSECGSIRVRLPEHFPQQTGMNPSLTLGIRPEDVLSVPPDRSADSSRMGCFLSGWPVVLAEPVGSGWYLTLARGSTRLRAAWPSGSPTVGAPLNWFLPADRCLWFDGPTGQRIVVQT